MNEEPSESGAEGASDDRGPFLQSNVVDEGAAEDTIRTKSRSELIIEEMLDPNRFDEDRSIWKFFVEKALKYPTIDEVAKETEENGPGVSAIDGLDSVHLKWYSGVLMMYRQYLQRSFEEPTEMPALAGRLYRWQHAHKGLSEDWHLDWTTKYKTEVRDSISTDKEKDARRQAALRRRQALQERSHKNAQKTKD